MTSREIFLKAIEAAGAKTKGKLNRAHKTMEIRIMIPKKSPDWFSLEYSYKGNEPTDKEKNDMYNSILTIFAIKQIEQYTSFAEMFSKSDVKIKDGKETWEDEKPNNRKEQEIKVQSSNR